MKKIIFLIVLLILFNPAWAKNDYLLQEEEYSVLDIAKVKHDIEALNKKIYQRLKKNKEFKKLYADKMDEIRLYHVPLFAFGFSYFEDGGLKPILPKKEDLLDHSFFKRLIFSFDKECRLDDRIFNYKVFDYKEFDYNVFDYLVFICDSSGEIIASTSSYNYKNIHYHNSKNFSYTCWKQYVSKYREGVDLILEIWNFPKAHIGVAIKGEELSIIYDSQNSRCAEYSLQEFVDRFWTEKLDK